MSKAVLISINPKWCELIANGKKTVEVRKTRPKLETPFKCYIYCTLPKFRGEDEIIDYDKGTCIYGCGKVIGEFVCDGITGLIAPEEVQAIYNATRQTCISEEEIKEYAKAGRLFYWHISDLVIYDKPQELNWFVVEGDCACMNCKKCSWFNRGNGYNVEDDCDLGYESIYRKKTLKPLFRPPQSWCYVEELDGEPNDRPFIHGKATSQAPNEL